MDSQGGQSIPPSEASSNPRSDVVHPSVSGSDITEFSEFIPQPPVDDDTDWIPFFEDDNPEDWVNEAPEPLQRLDTAISVNFSAVRLEEFTRPSLCPAMFHPVRSLDAVEFPAHLFIVSGDMLIEVRAFSIAIRDATGAEFHGPIIRHPEERRPRPQGMIQYPVKAYICGLGASVTVSIRRMYVAYLRSFGGVITWNFDPATPQPTTADLELFFLEDPIVAHPLVRHVNDLVVYRGPGPSDDIRDLEMWQIFSLLWDRRRRLALTVGMNINYQPLNAVKLHDMQVHNIDEAQAVRPRHHYLLQKAFEVPGFYFRGEYGELRCNDDDGYTMYFRFIIPKKHWRLWITLLDAANLPGVDPATVRPVDVVAARVATIFEIANTGVFNTTWSMHTPWFGHWITINLHRDRDSSWAKFITTADIIFVLNLFVKGRVDYLVGGDSRWDRSLHGEAAYRCQRAVDRFIYLRREADSLGYYTSSENTLNAIRQLCRADIRLDLQRSLGRDSPVWEFFSRDEESGWELFVLCWIHNDYLLWWE